MQYKTIIVDPDHETAQHLKLFLQEKFPEFTVVNCSKSIEEAVENILIYSPELVFMETELPDGKGFEIIEQCQNERLFYTIIVTNKAEYAIEALNRGILGYFLKPINTDGIKDAIFKFLNF